MNKIRWTFLLMCMCQAEIHFRKVGWITPDPSFGHIHFELNINVVRKHITTTSTAIESMRKSIQQTAFRDEHAKRRLLQFMEMSQLSVLSINRDFNDTIQLLGMTPKNIGRMKRFLGLLTALTSLTMSLFNQAQILSLSASISDIAVRQNHVIDILQEHEVKLHNISEKVHVIKTNIIKLANVVEDEELQLIAHQNELNLAMAITELQNTVKCVQKGFEYLLQHRIPLCLVDLESMGKSLKHLGSQAEKRGLILISDALSSLFQFEVSFVGTNEAIQIFIHVPLVSKTTLMDLLEFSNVPISITGGLQAEVMTNKPFLAINKQNQHAELSKDEVSTAWIYNDIRFPLQPIPVQKNMTSTCVGSIYSQNSKMMMATCVVAISKVAELIQPLGHNQLAIYSVLPQTIRRTCDGYTNHVAMNLHTKLMVKQNCEIETKNIIYKTGLNLFVDHESKTWPWIWNVSDIMDSVKNDEVVEIVKELGHLSTTPIPIQDIRKIIMMRSDQKVHLIFITLCCVSILIVVGILGFLGYRYCVLKRTSQKEKNDSQDEG